MRLLAVSDIHGEIEIARAVSEKTRESGVDAIICCGDFTTLGTAVQVKELLSLFNFAPLLAVPGNMDTMELLSLLEDSGVSLHGTTRRIDGVVFAGFGGGLLGNAGMCNFSEGDIENALGKVEHADVLVTHVPPQGTARARAANGAELGSSAVGKHSARLAPRLHLYGHVHEARGEEKIGKTTLLNPGPLKEGCFAFVEIGETVNVKMENV